DMALQNDLSLRDIHGNAAGVYRVLLGQPVADVLADAAVAAPVVPGAESAEAALGGTAGRKAGRSSPPVPVCLVVMAIVPDEAEGAALVLAGGVVVMRPTRRPVLPVNAVGGQADVQIARMGPDVV